MVGSRAGAALLISASVTPARSPSWRSEKPSRFIFRSIVRFVAAADRSIALRPDPIGLGRSPGPALATPSRQELGELGRKP
jgi:hypothetical protein